MKVIIVCEVSGVVRDAFNARGHDAWSCDIKPAQLSIFDAGPVKHIQDDALNVIGRGWDLLIGHPPCTYTSYVGTSHWNDPGRAEKRAAAVEFFMKLWRAPVPAICLENPLGCVSEDLPYSQIIHPYFHGDAFQKRTCLWLKNLPLLVDTNRLPKPGPKYIGKKDGKKYNWVDSMSGDDRQARRSKTFPGIARAMATQWGAVVSY